MNLSVAHRLLLVLALTLASTVGVLPVQPATAAAELALVKSSPSSVLSGNPVPFTMSATNPGNEPEYNLTFRDELPLGVTYTAGSTTPANIGDPRIVVNQVESPAGSGTFVAQQTLIWSNVADLQANDTYALRFSAELNATPTAGLPTYLVGSTVENSGQTFASPNPRILPRFDAQGVAIPSASVDFATDTSETSLSAIRITKAEPSAEGELTRGLHDGFPTVYTLKATVTEQDDIDGVVVTDYLPAGLEFLGCGGIDNTTDGAEEYPGSGGLGATPAVPGCTFPDSVETVLNPAPDGGTTYPPGIYTKLTWNLGDLEAGDVVTLPYAAGIGLRSNVAFAEPAASPTGGGQAANLDNNTGSSTRELEDERSVINRTRAGGTFQGAVAPGASTAVADTASATRTVEDFRARKTRTPGNFTVGGIATYTITIDTSEYTSSENIELTDAFPNGLCPLDDQANYAANGNSECDPEARFAPTITVDGATTPLPFDSVTPAAGGGFTIDFSTIDALADQSQAVITYYGRMRGSYEGGPLNGLPVVAGDDFANDLSASASSIPIGGTGETDPQTVGDNSTASLGSTGSTIDKRIYPREIGDTLNLFASGEPCPTDAAAYLADDDPSLDNDDLRFRLGDRVCFLLRLDLSDTVFTRNAVVTDFLPDGVVYDPGTMVPTASNDTNGLVFNEAGAASGDTPRWQLGAQQGGSRYVDPGGVFEVVLGGVVTEPADGDESTLAGNLMKATTQNTSGSATSLRAGVNLAIAPPADVSLVKGIREIDDPEFSTDELNVDGQRVEEGSVATFGIAVSNDGVPENGNGFGVRGVDVWDVLPQGITCAQISNITNFTDDTNGGPTYGTCTDPGEANHPTFTLRNVRSAIRWDFPVDPADPFGGIDRWQIDDGETRSLTYDMTIPVPTSAGVRLTNDAYLRSVEAFTNELNATAEYFPSDNIDDTVDDDDTTGPPVTDPSNVFTPGALTTKSATTSVVESNNNLRTEAVPGEIITYAYSVDIPARSSVFQATLTDVLPGQVSVVSPAPTGRFYPDATDTATFETLPPGFTVSSSGLLTFPETYTNSGATVQRFEVVLTARADNNFSNQPSITNTATFRSFEQIGGAPVVTPPARYTGRIRQPSPSVDKSADDTVVVAGQRIEYTLRARNANGRPPLHDTWMVDCIPAGIRFTAFSPGSGVTAGPEPGNGTNGCATGTTFIAFALDTVAGNNNPVTRTYTATAAPEDAGGTAYRNTVRLTGSSLNNGTANSPGDRPETAPDPTERTYSAQAGQTVNIPGSGALKTVEPSSATIGESVTYTYSKLIPKETNFYQDALLDELPDGLDVSTLELQGSSCQIVTDGSPSCDLSATVIGEPATTAGGSTVAFLVGDIFADPFDRILTITYTVDVADVPSNAAGVTLTNRARSVWDSVNTDAVPDGPGYPWDIDGIRTEAELSILEPDLTLSKSASSTSPEPGENFTYSLLLNNADGDFTSPAYNASITDVVPEGLDIFPDTISDGGSYDPTTRTITWEPNDLRGPLDPGGTITLTYEAQLAPSAEINGDALVNTAELVTYDGRANGTRRTYDGNEAQATVNPDFPSITTTKAATDGDVAYLDEPFTWTITATNDGTGRAYGVQVEDTLPTNWSYVPGSTTITFPDGTVSQADPVLAPAGDPTTATWAALGQLAPTQAVTITFDLVADSDVVDDPGIGSTIAQTNSAQSGASDLTGATGNADGPYGGDSDSAVTRIDAVDLLIDKSHDDTAPAIAGQNFTWQVDVSNLSETDTATGPFTVTDTLPSAPEGVGFVSATGPGWSCVQADGEVRCQRSNPGNILAPGAAFPPIDITVSIPSDAEEGTSLSNEASVVGRTYELDEENNTDVDAVEIGTLADLALAKGRTGEALAGAPLTYTIDLTNAGPSTSRGPITVTDTLPADTTFVSAVGGEGWETCTESAGVVSCTYADDIALGGAATQLVVTVDVSPSALGTLENTARITESATTDPEDDNNADSDEADVGTSADLRLEKLAQGTIVAGEETTYRLRVDNDGPSDAQPLVQITDELPEGATYVGSESVEGDWTCAPSAGDTAFACDLAGVLADGGFATVDVTVAIAADVVDPVLNSATVTSSTTPDPVQENNTDSDGSDFETLADLSIDKSSSGEAIAGEQAEWTLLVTNNGPSVSQAPITVSDSLPAGVEFVSAGGGGWGCDEADRIVTCVRDQPLAPGADAAPIALVVDIPSDAGPATLQNSATVAGTTNDPDGSNNSDEDEIVVSDLAELSIAKSTTGADPATAGESTEFTIAVDNAGPSDADTVTMSDTLPVGLTPTEAAGEGWECEIAGRTVSCTRATLAPGAAPAIVVTADVEPNVVNGTTLTNAASVSTVTTESGTEENTSESTVEVVATTDLSITKNHDTDAVRIGEELIFTISVTNAGPSSAADVVVTDTLPVGLTGLLAQGEGWTCSTFDVDPPTQDVECSYDSELLPGANSTELELRTLVTPEAFPKVENVAVADTSTPEEITDNNTAVDEVTVPAQADLEVTKTLADDEAAIVGESVTYALVVTNLGPIADPGPVTLTDVLPDGLSSATATSEDADCSVEDGTVTCIKSDGLAVDASFEVTLTAEVGAAAYPSLTNVASVSSPTDDPIADNDSDDETISVPPSVDLAMTKTHAEGATVGGEIVYTLTATNIGATRDPGPITIVDVLPDSLTPLSATGSGVDCAIDGQTVLCTANDPLDVDASLVVTLTAAVAPDTGPTVTNAALVSSPSTDTDASNNEAVNVADIIQVAQLRLDKSLASQVDQSATWTLRVFNDGPSTTTGDTVLIDTLPPRLVFVSASGSGWDCVNDAQVVTCTNPAQIGAGKAFKPVTLETEIRDLGGSEIVNAASVKGGGGEPPATDSASVDPPGLPVVDIHPPVDPADPPTDPGTPPTDPGTPPTDPGTPPTDPGTPPTDPGTPPTDPGTPPTDPGTDDVGDLPRTGSDSIPLMVLSALLLAAGSMLLLASRRRQGTP